MRVIAGKFRSRPLLAPAGMDTRPTADRLRETLFNVLTKGAVNRVEGAEFLDLYAGSGAVGIEALSRGASAVTFVEQGASALGILQKNLDALGIRGACVRIEKRSVGRFLRDAMKKSVSEAYGVVFLDPPYDLAEEYTQTLGLLGGECAALLAPGTLVVAEHRRKQALADSYGGLTRVRLLEQGDAALSFYETAS
ncbi:MAG TPA: 16S rRNA (guanine(966)-N(2))-methyltransferase RsmD [Acidobacteriaceae bacterium]|nr:16S rRNA (guanine(966)-N(2))-methyltransferase RsmD [Acidobacteriaceae bacterium]